MTAPRIVAVFDVGKTNVKVTIVDRVTRAEIDVRSQPNTIVETGPYPHYDVEALWQFLASSVSDLAEKHAIEGISVSAHGASVALLGEDGLVLPILDYEYDGPDELADAYNAIRPDFADTLSPRLPKGLTLGAQLYWLEERFPEEFARTRCIVTYPQYWTWRLTGLACNEITSIGCHTDLWNHHARTWSSLVARRHWLPKFAPLRSATEVQGGLLADLARNWGLPENLPVAGGLHDSNASLVPHLLDRATPFSVISSGTWAITFGVGAQFNRLDETRDVLANINVFGESVPSARFMGGREFELLVGTNPPVTDWEALQAVLARKIMVLPAVVPESGPFQGLSAAWSHELSELSASERHCAASLYLALMSATCLRLIEAAGPTIVEGPFSSNPIYGGALATLTDRQVLTPGQSAAGTSVGAALLFELQDGEAPRGRIGYAEVSGFDGETSRRCLAYAQQWYSEAERRRKQRATP